MATNEEEMSIPENFSEAGSSVGFSAAVGPFYRWNGEGPTRLAFRALERHANPIGRVHGGALMTLADQASGYAIARSLDEKRPFATVSLNCDFLAAARTGDWVEAEATITRRTRSLVFTHVRVSSGDELLLTASGIWKFLGE
jgi:uncharacterized protein (TIGR00369 family)